MNEIKPEHLTFSKLLNGRLFSIPDYQRAYSWTSRERNDLFEDINRVHFKNSVGSKDVRHFMSTIVCFREKTVELGVNEFDRLAVVDGQQRLTTLIILLNAIKISLKSVDSSREIRIRQELQELLVKPEGDNLLLLQTNHDTSDHFGEFLRDETAEHPNSGKTIADREILKAIADSQNFVEYWRKDGRELVNLVSLINNRLSFILHQISDEKLVYITFEVLNSRGMEVSWLDRLKSILMGAAFNFENDELIKNLRTDWSNIYKQIGLRQGLNTQALRFAATLWAPILPSRQLDEQDSVHTLRSIATDARQIRKVSKWILKVTKAYDELISNPRLNSVTRISQARLLAVAIYLRKNTEKDERRDLLICWEKVTFRIYGMMGYDARTGVGDYVRLAWRIINEDLSIQEIHKSIKMLGEYYPIRNAIDALRNQNCYEGWKEELRYLMYRYEEHLAKEKGQRFKNAQWERIWEANSSESIEHIFPQSDSRYDDIKHTLGNLMLLPPSVNSQLQNKNPEKKREAYIKTGLLIAVQVAEIPRFSKKAIRQREKDILCWAHDEWAD